MYSLPLCPSMIEKYPLSWFVYSLGSLYALASSQSAAAAGEEGINHRDTEVQRRQEDRIEDDRSRQVPSLPATTCPLCVSVSLWFIMLSPLDDFRNRPAGVRPVGRLVGDVQVGRFDPLAAGVAARH